MVHLFELAAQIVDNIHTYPGNANYQYSELRPPLLLLGHVATIVSYLLSMHVCAPKQWCIQRLKLLCLSAFDRPWLLGVSQHAHRM